MIRSLENSVLQFFGSDGEWSGIVRLDEVEALDCQAISADQDRGEADLDRLGDVIDRLSQVLGSDIGCVGVVVVEQNGADGLQRFVHKRDGGNAGEDREVGRLLGVTGCRGGGGGGGGGS